MTNEGVRKLALGSAQFGFSYGIANTVGQPDAGTVRLTLDQAAGAGVSMIDTAHDYKEAEAVLGRLLVDDPHFRIVSKTTALASGRSVADVGRAFQKTLASLGRCHIHGLLVHQANDPLGAEGESLGSWMQELKSDGVVERIGVSAYSPEQLSAILDRYEIDIVQLLHNVYNQQFARTGLLDRLHSTRVEVHSRSAFLQGLLLMPADHLPRQFQSIRTHEACLHDAMAHAGMTPVAGCLAQSLADHRINFVVVGCESLQQIAGILEAADQIRCLPDAEQFELHDPAIIDLSRWGALQ